MKNSLLPGIISESAIDLVQASGLKAAVGSQEILYLFPDRYFDLALIASLSYHSLDS